jgi:hypothetical protein
MLQMAVDTEIHTRVCCPLNDDLQAGKLYGTRDVDEKEFVYLFPGPALSFAATHFYRVNFVEASDVGAASPWRWFTGKLQKI